MLRTQAIGTFGAPVARQALPLREAIIHIIDDDEGLCSGLDRLFRSVGYSARAYSSVQAFLDAPDDDQPGCMVLDVRLPGMSGLDFQASLDELGVRLPVILMTGFGDIPMSVRAMKAGAVDFLAKPFRDQDMLDALARAVARDTARRRIDAGESEIRELFKALTPREREIMHLVVNGATNKEVADTIGLSIVTVKAHRGSLMRKMQVRTVPDLVRCGTVLGLT